METRHLSVEDITAHVRNVIESLTRKQCYDLLVAESRESWLQDSWQSGFKAAAMANPRLAYGIGDVLRQSAQDEPRFREWASMHDDAKPPLRHRVIMMLWRTTLAVSASLVALLVVSAITGEIEAAALPLPLLFIGQLGLVAAMRSRRRPKSVFSNAVVATDVVRGATMLAAIAANLYQSENRPEDRHIERLAKTWLAAGLDLEVLIPPVSDKPSAIPHT